MGQISEFDVSHNSAGEVRVLTGSAPAVRDSSGGDHARRLAEDRLEALLAERRERSGELLDLEHEMPGLYRIADALGTTMSDLLGKELLVDDQYEPEVSDSLKAFAKKERLRKEDVAMLARVNFRGRQPDDYDSWDLIWRAVKHSVRTSGR